MKTQEHYKNLYKNKEIGNNNLSIWQKVTYNDLILDNLKNKNILEIGVGPHGLIFKLNNNFKENKYFGVDLSDNVLDYIDSIGNIVGIKKDIGSEKLDEIEAGKIDIIIFNEVIEHIFDCQNAINEIYRILKKGGKLYISTHNTFNILMRLKYLFGYIPNPSLDISNINTRGEHIRIFNKTVILTLLNRGGFKTIKNHSFSGIHKYIFKTPTFLTNLLARHFYFICTKD